MLVKHRRERKEWIVKGGSFTPNFNLLGRTAPLTSKNCILYIYSTNIGTEYFKYALHSPFFSWKCSLFHNANLFDSCIIQILYTGCAKIKKNNSGAKGSFNSCLQYSLRTVWLVFFMHSPNNLILSVRNKK